MRHRVPSSNRPVLADVPAPAAPASCARGTPFFSPGRGSCGAHHGELLQGWFGQGTGPACPGLVTVPVPMLRARAVLSPSPVPGIRAEPGREKAARAAASVLAACDAAGLPRPPGAELSVDSSIPTGWGMGSSTADVVAALRAAAAMCRLPLTPLQTARLAVAAETASDPLPFGRDPVLFGHRHGSILQQWDLPFPRTLWLGCRCGHPTVDTVQTHRQEHQPTPLELSRYQKLREELDRALKEQSTEHLGEVATRSAELHQSLLPKTELSELVELSARCGGAGVQVAHSGVVAGLLFDAEAPDVQDRTRQAARLMGQAGLPPVHCGGLSGREPRPALHQLQVIIARARGGHTHRR